MTLDEAIQAANAGDVEAMYSLGDYYFDNKKYLDAWKWLTLAASQNHMPSAALALLLGDKMAHYYEALPDYEEAYDCWSKCQDCFTVIWENQDAPENIKEEAKKRLPDILYGLGYTSYCAKNYQGAKEFFELSINIASDKRSAVMLGLCYAKDNTAASYEKAYPLLKLFEQNQIDLGNNGVHFLVWMELAYIYRSAGKGLNISVVSNNMAASYHCVLQAAQIPGDCGEFAQEELKKYHKGFFGGYTYTE